MVKADRSKLFTMRMHAQDRADLEFIMRARGADLTCAEMIRQLIVEELGRTKATRAIDRARARGEHIHERPKA